MKIFFIVLFFGVIVSVSSPAREPVYNIENVTGDLYRFQSGDHFGVFLITEEGIIISDPINTKTALWLKTEIRARFGMPVKFVIHAHGHDDCGERANFFSDSAKLIVQVYSGEGFECAETPRSDIVHYGTFHRIELGETEILIKFFGDGYGQDFILFHFPEEETVYLSEIINRESHSGEIEAEILNAAAGPYLEQMDKLDFSHFISSHGGQLPRKEFDRQAGYMRDLYKEANRAVEQNLDFSAFQTAWKAFETENGFEDLAMNYGHLKRYYDFVLSQANDGRGDLIEKGKPRFPRNARQMGITGWVALEFDIDAEGTPVNISVIGANAESFTRGITDPSRFTKIFAKEAKRTLRKSIYERGHPESGHKALFEFSNEDIFNDYGSFGLLNIHQIGGSPGGMGSLIPRDYRAGSRR